MAAQKLTWDLGANFIFEFINYNIKGTVTGYSQFSQNFNFRNSVTDSNTQVQIGVSDAETAINLANFLNVKITNGFFQSVISCVAVGTTIEMIFGTSTLSATGVEIIVSDGGITTTYIVADYIFPAPVVITPTLIDGPSKIKFVNSPLFIREDADIDTKSISIELYIWDGQQANIPLMPNFILNKDKVSDLDNYISVEISDLIKPFIDPQFAYNRAMPPAINSQGVFVQAKIIKKTFANVLTARITPTFFCTLGYRWNYEQNIIADNGVDNYGASGFVVPVNKWYNPKIHDYFFQEFDFTLSVALCTSKKMVKYNAVVPDGNWLRCTRDSSLIVFLNKLGIWEQFTPHGKYTASTSVKRSDANVSHRDPSQIDNSYVHSRLNNSLEVKQSYVINSGSLTEDMTSIVEELIYSPKVYLIQFKGDLEEVSTVGITIDNTFVTIDDTIVTIDNQTVVNEALSFFKTHQQIPVIIADEDFTRKTRLNNKNEIDYNIKLDETNNKINSVR